jgi:hypothetical protein
MDRIHYFQSSNPYYVDVLNFGWGCQKNQVSKEALTEALNALGVLEGVRVCKRQVVRELIKRGYSYFHINWKTVCDLNNMLHDLKPAANAYDKLLEFYLDGNAFTAESSNAGRIIQANDAAPAFIFLNNPKGKEVTIRPLEVLA